MSDAEPQTYILEVCLSLEEARTARNHWMQRARSIPGAEVSITRVPLPADEAVYWVHTQTAELVPAELMEFHREISAGVRPEIAAQNLLRHNALSEPPLIVDLTERRGWFWDLLTSSARNAKGPIRR